MHLSAVLAVLLLPLKPLPASPVDTAAIGRIREEAHERSRVMEFAQILTDVHGPRFTGTPAFRAAGEWARGVLHDMDLRVDLEPIDWGRGWALEHAAVHLLEPQIAQMIAAPIPWSPPTDGTVEGETLLVPLPGWETPDSYRQFFDTWRGRLRGRVLLASPEISTDEPDHAELPRARLTDEELHERIRRQEAEAARTSAREEEATYDPGLFSSPAFFAYQDSLHRFLHEEGVLGILYASGVRGGTVHLNGPMRLQPAWLRHANRALPPPSFVVAPEHYAHLLRQERNEAPATIRLELRSRFYDDPRNAFNVIAELPGHERPEEFVMIGAHLDAWPLATGATDNAAGAAVMMEAMRILTDLDLPLRRSVRLALWGGHEGEGLGSRTYVQRHLDAGYPETWLEEDEVGRRHEPRPDYDLLSAYFNLDYLAGRIRGIFLQENEAARSIFEAWLAPFGAEGADNVSAIIAGGSDHMAFEDVGLPSFPFIQDGPLHDVHTHHSNMDVFDYLEESDLKQSAMILAAIVYHAATREERLPRK